MFRQMAIVKDKTFVFDPLTSTKITCFFNLSRVVVVKFLSTTRLPVQQVYSLEPPGSMVLFF